MINPLTRTRQRVFTSLRARDLPREFAWLDVLPEHIGFRIYIDLVSRGHVTHESYFMLVMYAPTDRAVSMCDVAMLPVEPFKAK